MVQFFKKLFSGKPLRNATKLSSSLEEWVSDNKRNNKIEINLKEVNYFQVNFKTNKTATIAEVWVAYICTQKQWRNMKTNEWTWRQMKAELKVNDGKWKQMKADESKWMEMIADEGNWRQMGADEGKWRHMKTNEWKWRNVKTDEWIWWQMRPIIGAWWPMNGLNVCFNCNIVP